MAYMAFISKSCTFFFKAELKKMSDEKSQMEHLVGKGTLMRLKRILTIVNPSIFNEMAPEIKMSSTAKLKTGVSARGAHLSHSSTVCEIYAKWKFLRIKAHKTW